MNKLNNLQQIKFLLEQLNELKVCKEQKDFLFFNYPTLK